MKLLSKCFFLALIFLGSLSACNTIEGMGEDIEATGEAIDEEAEES